MSAFRKAVKARDKRARELGYVPREIAMPRPSAGSVQSMRCLLHGRAHAAMLRRIKG